jgi:hypothetical protein
MCTHILLHTPTLSHLRLQKRCGGVTDAKMTYTVYMTRANSHEQRPYQHLPLDHWNGSIAEAKRDLVHSIVQSNVFVLRKAKVNSSMDLLQEQFVHWWHGTYFIVIHRPTHLPLLARNRRNREEDNTAWVGPDGTYMLNTKCTMNAPNCVKTLTIMTGQYPTCECKAHRFVEVMQLNIVQCALLGCLQHTIFHLVRQLLRGEGREVVDKP